MMFTTCVDSAFLEGLSAWAGIAVSHCVVGMSRYTCEMYTTCFQNGQEQHVWRGRLAHVWPCLQERHGYVGTGSVPTQHIPCNESECVGNFVGEITFTLQ